MLNAPVRDIPQPRAQLRAPFGVPLVNADAPAWTVQEFLGLARAAGIPMRVDVFNQAIRNGNVPGGFLDRDDRPCVAIAETDAAIEYCRRCMR